MGIFDALKSMADNTASFKSASVNVWWKGKLVDPYFMVLSLKTNIRVPVAEVSLDIEQGPDASRMTATRVITGGVLLGPVGMILGGMAKKGYAHNNLVVTTNDEVVRIPFKASEYGAAIKFIEDVARIQANNA